MSHAFRVTVMVAAAAGALSGMAGERLYAQGADPNAAPYPYKMQENWAQLSEGRKFGAAIKVQVDHSDGRTDTASALTPKGHCADYFDHERSPTTM